MAEHIPDRIAAAVAGWDDPLPDATEGVLDDDDAHAGEHVLPGDPAWAGDGYGRPGLECLPFVAWRCLECPKSGGSLIRGSADEVARAHAIEKRHIVQMTAITTWIPGERR
jgi:hypothetical protein